MNRATIVAMMLIGIGNFLSAQNEETRKVDYSKIGNKLICPVTGEEFYMTDKTPSTNYNGRIFFFCCPACVEKFQEETEKYLKSNKKSDCHIHKHMNKKDFHKSSVKSFSFQEISKHNKKGDCWLIVDSKVYNVSDFTYKHNRDILSGCGKDATRLFKTRIADDGKKIGSGMPHSENARKMLEKFYIGELDQNSISFK